MAPLLYKMDTSPPSSAVRMLADIIGIELEYKNLDFVALEHKSPEFLKINPIGAVPVLQDGDFIVSDSHVIMKYLLSKYGGDKSESLYPSDLRTRTVVDQAMYFNTGVYFLKIKLVALPSVFGDVTETSDQYKEEIDSCYSVLEVYLQNRKYIAADHLTIADLALGSTTSALKPIHKLDRHKFPRTADWFSRLEEEPYFKKIMTPGTELMGKVLHSCWERNKQKRHIQEK